MDDMEKDCEVQKALEKDDNACISITIEVAEITEEEFSEINSNS